MRTKISSITSPLFSTLGCATLLALLPALPAFAAPGDLDPLDLSISGSDVRVTAVQPDGKTIIAGNFTQVLGVARNYIARINADGTLDTVFNPNANNSVNSVAIQEDGKVLLGGFFTTLSPNGGAAVTRNYVARVNADGTLDTGFNPSANNTVFSVALQADGKVLLGGVFTTLSPNGGAAVTRNRIARIYPDGTLDTGFNPNANNSVNSVAVQADGKVLLAGQFFALSPNGGAAVTRNRIARVNADGTLDTGFNPNASSSVRSVAVQADGKVLLGGGIGTLSPNGGAAVTRNYVARVNADGTLDTGFNPNANGSVNCVAVQADGKVLLGGLFTALSPNGGAAVTRNYVARVNADGTLDTGFNPNPNGTSVASVGVRPDGKVLLGGTFTSVGGISRNLFAQLVNDTATQTLTATSTVQADWLRGGAGPEVEQVSFDLSTDGGTTWNPLGVGSRVGTTANWRCIGLSLPASGHLRARGRTAGGYYNGSSGLIEQVAAFSFAVAPAVTGISPASGSTAGGTVVTITGIGFTGATGATVGGVALTGFSLVNATTITGTTGAGPAGAANVAVTGSPNGASTGGTGIFTYLASGSGSLDSLNLGISGYTVLATAVQPDGKTIIAGNFAQVLGVARNHIARINADGTLDMGFNPNANDVVLNVVVQTDGKVLLGGRFTTLSPNGGVAVTRNRIARVNADGTLDTGFNPNASNYVESVAVQPDGKVLLGGLFTLLSPNGGAAVTRNRIARVNADGTLDTSFNPNSNGVVYCLAVQEDGKVLLGGLFATLSPNGGAAVARNNIARVNADGTLDTGFNPNAGGSVSSVAVQADGKVLLGGDFTALSPNGGASVTRNRIARVNADGTLDTGFDPNVNSGVLSVAVQMDGKVLLGGWFTTLSPNGGAAVTRNNIARVNANGTLDTGFNPNANNYVFSVAVQADGKLLLGGTFSSVGGTARNLFARLVNDSATQTLAATSAAQADWSRGGAGPEVEQVSFDLSTDGGTIWIPLGPGSRVGTTANWQRTGLSLPASGHLRARGRTAGGYHSGCSGLIEQVAAFSFAVAPAVTGISPASGSTAGGTVVTITGIGFTGATGATVGGVALTGFSLVNATTITGTTGAGPAGAANVAVTGSPNGASTGGMGVFTYVTPLPEIAIEQPAGTNLTDGVSNTGFGTVTIGANISRVFTVRNIGTGDLTGISADFDGGNTSDFSFVSSPSATLTPGASTTFEVRFTPSAAGNRGTTLQVTSNDSDENPFDISLTGVGESPLAIAQRAYVKASNTGANDAFGGSFDDGGVNTLPLTSAALAISGDTMVIGAPEEDSASNIVNGNQSSNALSNSGAAYVFVRGSDGIWSQQAYLKPSDPAAEEKFGWSVAISGDTIAIGAPWGRGRAYVFQRSGTTWNEQAPLPYAGSLFGYAVAIEGDLLMVGAPTDFNGGSERGAVLVYNRTGTNWVQSQKLVSPTAGTDDNFGFSIDFAGDLAVFGVPGEDSNSVQIDQGGTNNSATNSGAAHVFRRISGTWTPEVYLKPFNTSSEDYFGWSVGVSGESVVIGAPYEDGSSAGVDMPSNDNLFDAGAAYVFAKNGGIWTQQAYLKAGNPSSSDVFGLSVAASGKGILIGALGEDSAATGVNAEPTGSVEDSGAAYVFSREGTQWSQLAFLKASNRNTEDFFGFGVALAGSTAVVSAIGEDSGATGVGGDETRSDVAQSGAAYVFHLGPLANSPGGNPSLSDSIAAAGLTGDDALPNATPFNDGVENLLKYAFNMNLAGPDVSVLQPDTGTSGLPTITTPNDAPTGTLRFEFLRRKGSGLAYTPQKSTSLDGTGWSPLSAAPVVTSIDDQWERVVYTEAPEPVPAPACFGRVSVSLP